MSIEHGKEYQWRLVYTDNHVHEFIGTYQDVVASIGRRWLIDNQSPLMWLFREDIDSPFRELKRSESGYPSGAVKGKK